MFEASANDLQLFRQPVSHRVVKLNSFLVVSTDTNPASEARKLVII
jgi:hypothetical protein